MVKMQLDTSQFEKAMSEYVKVNRRNMSDIVNAKLFFIARNAVNNTKKSDKAKIKNELMAPSKINPQVPLAAILVNKERKRNGFKGLNGSELKSAIKRFINRRISSIGFLKSGWLPAIRILESVLRSSGGLRGAPRLESGANQYQRGKDKGRALSAKPGIRSFGLIENEIDAHGSPEANAVMLRGLQRAINEETVSMNRYITDKIKKANENFNK